MYGCLPPRQEGQLKHGQEISSGRVGGLHIRIGPHDNVISLCVCGKVGVGCGSQAWWHG